MLATILFTMLIIAIALALLSIKIIIKKGGKFSSQHIHDNVYLRKKGIHCVLEQDREEQKKNKSKYI